MKKYVLLLLALLLMCNVLGCGGSDQSGESQDGRSTAYKDALEVMTAVFEAYKEEEIFAIYGGDQENAVMGAPGKFDISKTEELTYTLCLPEVQISSIDDAASMVHMMNGNTFTGAAYHLAEGTDPDDFVDAVKTGILNTQWVCGFPDTLLIINAGGGYIVTAYGEAEIMETFKTNALTALTGAEVMVETPIA